MTIAFAIVITRQEIRLMFVMVTLLLPFVGSVSPSEVWNLARPVASVEKLSCYLKGCGTYFGASTDAVLQSFGSRTRQGDLMRSTEDATDERINEFDRIGAEVEDWAERILQESEEDDWIRADCTNIFRSKYNHHGRTVQHVKWMQDSRGRHADPRDTQLHPCMRLYSVVDAPIEIVCRYLSQERRYRDYNSLMADHHDVEDLTPHSKICWSQTIKLLFIQPREFITFCHHRWRPDGTQVVVNQACDHPDKPFLKGTNRAYALRGATFLSRHPDDPQHKTKVIMLAHASCGRDVPEWAVRTAVKILAPIKPFEIMYQINEGVKRARQELEKEESMCVNQNPSTAWTEEGRCARPAGIAQMGYGCFWPNGGGKVESPHRGIAAVESNRTAFPKETTSLVNR